MIRFLWRAMLMLWISLAAIVDGYGQQLPERYRNRSGGVSVVVFLAVDCPISQKYMHVLNNIVTRYADTVAVTGIIPGKIKKEDVEAFRKEYQVGFPLRINDAALLKELNASVTPEVFVFDRQHVLKYQGAIDNWFYELGRNRQQITAHYMHDAIRASIDGTALRVTKTEAVGCLIQRKKKSRNK